MKLRNGRRYLAFLAGCALAWPIIDALLTLTIHRGFDPPQQHPFIRKLWIVDRNVMSNDEWHRFTNKYPILALTTWIFLTAGTSTTLPNDFTSTNSIYAIGAGSAGAAGSGGTPGNNGVGGVGGAGGAFAQINNYSAHTAGQSVTIQVGVGDTIWDSSAVLLAKAASGSTGGASGSSVGSTKFSGGNGGTGTFGGAGGGGAAGLHGAGNNGGNGSPAAPPNHGAGGTGDAGNTAANANGTQFGPNASSQFVGSGGGGDGGDGPGTPVNGGNGTNAGLYGAGGGGGGGGGATCIMGACTTNGGAGGNGTQGLIAFSYTPNPNTFQFGIITGL